MWRERCSTSQGNIFAGVNPQIPEEIIEVLLTAGPVRLERIISTGQATPAGEWYDQESHEWVLVLTGRAEVLLEPGGRRIILGPGDYLHIPAHCRHRVEWTDPGQPTIWLALHYGDAALSR